LRNSALSPDKGLVSSPTAQPLSRYITHLSSPSSSNGDKAISHLSMRPSRGSRARRRRMSAFRAVALGPTRGILRRLQRRKGLEEIASLVLTHRLENPVQVNVRGLANRLRQRREVARTQGVPVGVAPTQQL